MSRPETCGNTPELKNLGEILNIWHKRAQHYTDSNSYLDFFWNGAEANGNENLEAIFSQNGKEPALQLLSLVDGFNLEIQARLLSLGRGNAPILIKAIEASRKRPTRWELMLKRIRPKADNLSSQKEVYRRVVREMLAVKFPGQEVPRLMAKFPSASVLWSGRVFWTAELALQKGPDFLLEAFGFIPFEEIRPDSFDERLEFEKRARKEGRGPVSRVYRFTGRVQGVGFRDFCWQKASCLWGRCCSAKNEKDGSVTVILQGLPEALDKYMADFCQAAAEDLGIPLPNVNLEREDSIITSMNPLPIPRGAARKIDIDL